MCMALQQLSARLSWCVASLTLLRLGWWKLVSLLLLTLTKPDVYVCTETQLIDEYFAGVSNALFVFL